MTNPADKLYDSLQWVCLVLAGLFILAFVHIAFSSMTYPFHLEWMEGQSIDVVQRIRDGLPLYTAPSLEYVPFLYTPYYYYVVAFVSLFTGVDFFPARLVSTLAALGVSGILYAWVRKEGGSWRHGLIAAGLFLATYKLSGRWFDNSRIDSLALLLTLAGLYVFFHYRGTRSAICAAVLFIGAFFTKQSAVLAITPVLGAWLLVDRRHALVTGLATAISIVIIIAAANAATGGWFSFYVFDVAAGHKLVDERYVIGFWKREMLKPVGILFGLGALGLLYLYRENKNKALAYAALAGGLVVGSYIMRLHTYSYLNVLMPAHAALALFTGLAFVWAERGRQQSAMALVPVLAIIQLIMLVYNPEKMIPTQKAVDTGNQFLQEIAKIEGDIFMPELQWVQTRVGKKSYGYGMAAFDIMRSNLGEKNHIKRDLAREMAEAVRSGRFVALIPGRLFRLPEKKRYYVYKRHIPYPGEFVTGAINYIQPHLWVRKEQGHE